MHLWGRPNPLRFELLGFTNVIAISTGGFSTIYRAYQPQLSRTVAIKVLDPRCLTKQHLRNRFERECKAQGMLGNHQNVVTIFGAGFDKSGRPYIIMEYLPKGSLTNRLKTGPLRWQEVSRLG
jgi:serine/threonine-protein kinase PknK